LKYFSMIQKDFFLGISVKTNVVTK
jgi:hypothetical protein